MRAFITTTLASLGCLLAAPAIAQDDPRTEVQIIRPDQLPGPTWAAEHKQQLETLRAGILPVRVTLDLNQNHYSSVTKTPAMGVAFLLALPNQPDEPGVLITATQLLQRARRIEVRHPDGSWHTARVALSDPALGLAILDAPTPDTARPLTLADSKRMPYALTNATLPPDHNVTFLSARLGAPGEEALAFYQRLETLTASIGAPVVDERGELRAVVGLVIYEGDQKGHWALDHGVVSSLLKRVSDPQRGSERVRRETLEFTNPLQPTTY